MGNSIRRAAFGFIAFMALHADVYAQFGYPIQISSVDIGLPAGRFGNEKDQSTQRALPVSKRGMWAPVSIALELQREIQTGLLVKIEAQDGDGSRTSITLPLIASLAGQPPGARLNPADFAYVPYVCDAARATDVIVTLLSNDGSEKVLAEPFRVRSNSFKDASSYVILSLGSRLPGFDLPTDNNANVGATRAGLRGGRIETAAIMTLAELPDHWLGYQTADLVVIPTGVSSPGFLDELFADNAQAAQLARRNALLEWVRRGGKLIVSVGINSARLAQYQSFQAMLPRTIKLDPSIRSVGELTLAVSAGGAAITERLRARTDPPLPFPVANLNEAPTGRAVRTLVHTQRQESTESPLVVQSNVGLGRITLVAFDLDTSPFLDYASRSTFWDYLIRECGSAKASLQSPNQTQNYNENYEDEWLSTMRNHIDTFDGVPVVSFGWVALFIAFYTLLIGPIEYLFLKHVIGKLELTWITFPLIVASVSAAAYFTAYAIKGNDLKLNKIDVVDVDLASNRVYGHSWFSIFSPRIDNYTIGVAPRDNLVAPSQDGYAANVGWMGGGNSTAVGGLGGRSYTIHTMPISSDIAIADGLVRVPIPVWSTKSFTSSWRGNINSAQPLVVSELFHPPGDLAQLAGSFTNNLPFGTIQDAVMIYGGTAYKLPPMMPGQRVDVQPILGKADETYFKNTSSTVRRNDQNTYPTRNADSSRTASSMLDLKGMLFHEESMDRGTSLANSSLRHLDQSWRLRGNIDEVIIYGSIRANGSAEELLSDPAGASATRLWLKELPGSGKPRPVVPGTLRQETFVRVYIPVTQAQ